MTPFRDLFRGLRVLVRRESETEIDDELRYHLEREIEENLRRGMTPVEARRRAEAAFGRVENVKDEVRDVRRTARLLGDLRHDARVGLRALPREPAFSLAVLVTLGLGIGGNVAMLGVIDATVLRPLPYPEADRLVLGQVTYDGERGNTVSGPDFFDYRDEAGGLAGLSALTPFPVRVAVTGAGPPERIRAPIVSTGFFETLGIEVVAGRGFIEAEGMPDAPNVVVLSHELWQRRFGGDAGVIGTTIALGGTPYAIVGVVAPGFRFLIDADAWRPIRRGVGLAEARQFHNFVLVGRLAPGVALTAAQAEIDVISSRLEGAYPDTNAGKGLRLTPLREALGEPSRGSLRLLLAAVGLLLLVASANVAGLLVVRGHARRPEMAVRSVMGAGRGRLARQLLTENGLLAMGAAAIGLLVALLLQRGLLALVPLDRIGTVDIGLSPVMFGGAAALALVAVGLFGVVPALTVARGHPAGELRSGARATVGREATRLQSSMVVAQVALASVLLAVAGLLLRSLSGLEAVDPGFEPSGLLTAEVALPAGEFGEVGPRIRLFDQLRERAAGLPGVGAVGLVSRLPIRDTGGNVRVARPEDWGRGGVLERLAYQRIVLPGFFDAMGIPLLSGRDAASTDGRDSPPVVVISAGLAEDLFGAESPLGRLVGMDVGRDDPATAEVIGVVGDVVPYSLVEGTEPTMYFPYGQRSPAAMRIVLRTAGDPAALTPALREAVSELAPRALLADAAPMDELLSGSLSGRRSVMTAVVGFSLVAVLLSALGLYVVLAYHVARRVHEIGIRMALGATVTDVSGAIVRRGLALATIGLVVGIPLWLVAGRFVRGMLYEVGTTDPVTYLGVAAFVTGVTFVACLVPARRAGGVDPAEAFRAE